MICDKEKKNYLRIATDAKLNFDSITDINSLINSARYESWYHGKIFIYVAKINPDYLFGIINRHYFSPYGEYSRFYESDHGLEIKNFYLILEQLSNKNVKPDFINKLKKLHHDIEKRNAEARLEYIEFEKEMWKQYIEDGYREAYNDDPDAIWNTD